MALKHCRAMRTRRGQSVSVIFSRTWRAWVIAKSASMTGSGTAQLARVAPVPLTGSVGSVLLRRMHAQCDRGVWSCTACLQMCWRRNCGCDELERAVAACRGRACSGSGRGFTMTTMWHHCRWLCGPLLLWSRILSWSKMSRERYVCMHSIPITSHTVVGTLIWSVLSQPAPPIYLS